MLKKCNKCLVDKPTGDFPLRSDTGRRRNSCKSCHLQYHKNKNKEWYEKNKEKNYKRSRSWHLENKEKSLELQRNWYQENVDKVLEKNKKYKSKNPDKVKGWARKKYLKAKEDPQKLMKMRIGSRISMELKKRGGSKEGKSSFKNILPYSAKDLVFHLESNFEIGMAWDNYGEWHIDHKTPDSWFNYKSTEDEGFKKSWALENLQPMWKSENCSKRNKYRSV